MTTKEDGMFLKQQFSLAPYSQTDINSQFLNLNLNQSYLCSGKESHVHSYSKSKNDKHFRYSTVTQNYQEKRQSWNKTSKNSSLIASKNHTFNVGAKKANDIQKGRRSDKQDTSLNTKSSSTLSLHIAAYENSLEVGSNEIKDLPKKSNSGEFIPPKSQTNQDLFEFPRQMEGKESKIPEVQQFTASQKLLSPNQGASSTQIQSFPPKQTRKMLRYCYAQDQTFTFRNSNFLGVRIGVWGIFALFLEVFLNLSHLCLLPFSFTKAEAAFFPSLKVPNYELELTTPVLVTTILQMIILPFGFIGFLILNRHLFSLTTIITIFQSILFFIFGIIAISYHTITSTKPLTFLGIQLLLSVPIHIFCSIIFINFSRFSQFYDESIKNNYDFGNFVERTHSALKKQRNQLNRQSFGNAKLSNK